MNTHRLWFAGTPPFAAHTLKQLLASQDYLIDAVLTQPDRPAGRGRALKTSAVKDVALRSSLKLEQPERLSKLTPPFANIPRPDLIIVAAYGLLLPQWFLDYPRMGCINIHASLLPRWRGAAPIQRAIAAGDHETGISIMQMEAGLDTGPVWLRKHLIICADDNADTLTQKLTSLGSEALLEALPQILAGTTKPTPQSETGVIYAHKLSKAEALIDWNQPAKEIARKIRAYNPVPMAYALLENNPLRLYNAHEIAEPISGKPGLIFRHDKNGLFVSTGEGTLLITKLQFPGKQAVDSASLVNGRNLEGKQFS